MLFRSKMSLHASLRVQLSPSKTEKQVRQSVRSKYRPESLDAALCPTRGASSKMEDRERERGERDREKEGER